MKILSMLSATIAGMLALASLSLESAAAGNMTEFYTGKTIRLVVGYGKGGGYDTFARLIAPLLEQETGANVVVENKPGSGGLAVLNDTSHSKPDGLTLTVANVSASVTALLLASDAAMFHSNDFVWLGGIASDARVLLLADGTRLEDWLSTLQTPPLIRWAALGKSDSLALSAALLTEAFGLKSRIITGFSGTSEAIAGLLRGQADAVVISLETARQFIDTTGFTMAAVLSRTRSELAPEVPTIYELNNDPAAEKWLDYQVNLSGLGRALIVAPGTPRANVKFLSAALERILTSEEFVAAAASRGRSVRYTAAEDIENITRSILTSATEADKKQLRQMLANAYF
uniref:Bug family tripartite tricarboxylate transporter substrate binding protein n=1 Tax=Pararhizobium sp. IMCC3301 TaxID=3067904 RepID=UPI002741A8D0|nr:tripartite tricarboxylate transporter substrate-binding protein [Pararhizobium sp. IMCC3301]